MGAVPFNIAPQFTHDAPAGLRLLYPASKSKGRRLGFEPRQHTRAGFRLIYQPKETLGGRDPRKIKTPFQTFNFKRIV